MSTQGDQRSDEMSGAPGVKNIIQQFQSVSPSRLSPKVNNEQSRLRPSRTFPALHSTSDHKSSGPTQRQAAEKGQVLHLSSLSASDIIYRTTIDEDNGEKTKAPRSPNQQNGKRREKPQVSPKTKPKKVEASPTGTSASAAIMSGDSQEKSILQENQSLRKRVAELKKQNETLKMENESLKADLSDTKTQTQELKGDNDRRMKKDSNTIRELEERAGKLQIDLTEAYKKLCDETEEKSKIRHKLEQDIAQLIKTKQQEIENVKRKNMQELTELQREKTEVEQKLRERIKEKKRKIQELEGTLVIPKSPHHEAKSRESTLEKKRNSEVIKKLEDSNKMLEDSNYSLKVSLNLANRIQERLDWRYKQHMQRHSKPPQYQNIDANSLEGFQIQPRQNLVFSKMVGAGAFGCVFDVWLSDGTRCIAKRLHNILMGQGGHEPVAPKEQQACYERFLQECVLLSRTDHPNIVRFIGVQFGAEKFDLTLFMEKLVIDLHKYLESNPGIESAVKVSILYDVSCGLLYLHEQCSIIHRDLSARNILLTVKKEAKIADLGVSRILNRKLDMTRQPGNLAYMSPEARAEHTSYDESLDVFSMGVLMIFTVTQEYPEYSFDHIPDIEHKKGEGEIFRRHKWIDKMEERIKTLVKWCLLDNPIERPSTFCLNISLRELKNEYDHPWV